MPPFSWSSSSANGNSLRKIKIKTPGECYHGVCCVSKPSSPEPESNTPDPPIRVRNPLFGLFKTLPRNEVIYTFGILAVVGPPSEVNSESGRMTTYFAAWGFFIRLHQQAIHMAHQSTTCFLIVRSPLGTRDATHFSSPSLPLFEPILATLQHSEPMISAHGTSFHFERWRKSEAAPKAHSLPYRARLLQSWQISLPHHHPVRRPPPRRRRRRSVHHQGRLRGRTQALSRRHPHHLQCALLSSPRERALGVGLSRSNTGPSRKSGAVVFRLGSFQRVIFHCLYGGTSRTRVWSTSAVTTSGQRAEDRANLRGGGGITAFHVTVIISTHHLVQFSPSQIHDKCRRPYHPQPPLRRHGV